MQHFYVFNFNKKRRVIFLLGLAFCTALVFLIYPSKMLPQSEQTDTVITKGNNQERKLALTFNISWGEDKVYDILKVLKDNKTQATFFISGEWAERHPQIVKAIQDDTHEIGMLGYRYKNYIEQEPEQVKKDMLYAKKIFEKMDIDTTYIRPPSGLFNKEVIDIAESLNLEVVHWSINPNDWTNPGVNEIQSIIQDEADNGDIILLHASDSAKQTAEALSAIIPSYQKKELTFVTISELVNDITLKKELVE